MSERELVEAISGAPLRARTSDRYRRVRDFLSDELWPFLRPLSRPVSQAEKDALRFEFGGSDKEVPDV